MGVGIMVSLGMWHLEEILRAVGWDCPRQDLPSTNFP